MKKSTYVFAVIGTVFLAFLVIGSLAFTASLNEQKKALSKATEPLDEVELEMVNGILTTEADYWREEDARIAQEVLYQRMLSKKASKKEK